MVEGWHDGDRVASYVLPNRVLTRPARGRVTRSDEVSTIVRWDDGEYTVYPPDQAHVLFADA